MGCHEGSGNFVSVWEEDAVVNPVWGVGLDWLVGRGSTVDEGLESGVGEEGD